ncbi:MAG: response regulator [Persicimonas sp.]
MESDVKDPVEELAEELVDVRDKFVKLARGDASRGQGYRSIADGLAELLGELEADAATHQARLEVVLRGLRTLAELMSARELPGDRGVQAEAVADDPASEFREMFRKEARKRLSGLSISMMGIFSENASQDALSQTADHLHAMKGASAMVGLSAISRLVSAMEQVVVDMKRQSAAERTWPTRWLMRGFHLLENAVGDAHLNLDVAAADEVVGALAGWRNSGGALASAKAAPAAPASDAPASTKPASVERTTEELPAHQRVNDDERSPSPLDSYEGPLEKRILVVDDVETIAASVGFVLSELGVPIDMAEHGEEALEVLRRRPYSLVISDVSMPRMDGVALTRMIRADEATSEIPVILLTSLDRPDERDAGIEAGATDYIIKGAIGGGELLSRVKELLEFAPDVPAGDFRSDNELRRILIAEDVETIAASIAFVLSEGPFEIEIARNGAKALARLREGTYDLLLSDVQMPEMGGLELLQTIRADDVLGELPVILLTSLQDPEVQQEALDMGADRFLIKGEVGGDRLREIVKEVASPVR